MDSIQANRLLDDAPSESDGIASGSDEYDDASLSSFVNSYKSSSKNNSNSESDSLSLEDSESMMA